MFPPCSMRLFWVGSGWVGFIDVCRWWVGWVGFLSYCSRGLADSRVCPLSDVVSYQALPLVLLTSVEMRQQKEEEGD